MEFVVRVSASIQVLGIQYSVFGKKKYSVLVVSLSNPFGIR